MNLRAIIYAAAVIGSCLLPADPAQAVGEELIEAVMRSDFVFDRNISNVPFFPLAYLSTTYSGDNDFDQCPVADCSFSWTSISQGLGLPVWVGQQDMFLLGESLELDRLESGGRELDLVSAGVLVAWIRQHSPSLQYGAFVYAYDGIDEDVEFNQPNGNYAGIMARYRHEERLHSYWGVVRVSEENDALYYPYAGLDWYVGDEWSLSLLLPWPAVTYAPQRTRLYRFGALYNGSDWSRDSNGDLLQTSLGRVNFGFSYEQKLDGLLWLEAGVGYSGLGRAVLQSGDGIDFESNISNEPYLRISLNFRP